MDNANEDADDRSVFRLAALILGAAVIPALAPAAAIGDPVTGIFGGYQTMLVLDDHGGTVTWGCMHGKLAGPVLSTVDGHFTAMVELNTDRPGPQRDDQPAGLTVARLDGVFANGDLMLTLKRAEVAPITVITRRGRATRIVRCY